MQQAASAADFGKVIRLPEKAYPSPEVYPEKGAHPRLLFTKASLETVRKNLSAEENQPAYRQYLAFSQEPVTGILEPVTVRDHANMDYHILAVIEAKAFRYALTRDTACAQEALSAIKNYIRTLDIPEGVLGDECRAYGYVIYIAACVYDWCYDALTALDREQLVAGCETILAPHMEVEMPPVGQGSVTGHGTEAQILRDWLALAIAAYDEYPDIYEFIGGRVFHAYRPDNDYYLASGSHWQGSAYGPYRQFFLAYAQHIIGRMTDGRCALFLSGLHDAALTFLQYLRPDGQLLRVGDDFNEYGNHYVLGMVSLLAFLTGSYYKDPVLKGFAKERLQGFTSFTLSNTVVSPVMFLVLNDPEIPCAGLEQLPLIWYNGSPLGSVIARSAWKDPDAFQVYMKVGESYSANHEHKDAGSFQIYYKGILASDSGVYDAYYTPEDMAYNKQTISSNALLLFNPEMKDNGGWIYSGGQTIQGDANIENLTVEEWLRKRTSHQARILGHGGEAAEDGFRYAYLAGDITNAYDPETAEKVTRRMLAAATGNPEAPLIFAVYDDVTVKDAGFKKTFLLHMQQEPVLTGDGFAILRGKYGGTLVAQSCLTPMTYTAIGGPGREFWVNDRNYPPVRTYADDTVLEAGWGRVEMTPAEPGKTHRLLTVMYAADSGVPLMKAEELETEKLAGAAMFGCVILFSRNGETLEEPLVLPAGNGTSQRYFLSGAAPGLWNIAVNGRTISTAKVSEESGILAFSAPAGTVTVSPADR